MARKLQPVTKLPARRNVPPSRLTSVVGKSSERDMLAVLRRKLAAQLDKADVPPTALAALVRQFREIDREVRGMDLVASQLAASEGDLDDDDDGPGSAGWDRGAI
jgi:hypothetical protein